MAYPTVSGPYGLVPVKLLSGTPYAGTVRQYKIASGYGSSISSPTSSKFSGNTFRIRASIVS